MPPQYGSAHLVDVLVTNHGLILCFETEDVVSKLTPCLVVKQFILMLEDMVDTVLECSLRIYKTCQGRGVTRSRRECSPSLV